MKPDLQPDLVGGRYRLVSAIAQGGMGTVWLGRDETLRRDVAVKQVGLLPGESVTDSARALREARSSAALSHRNVVTVFDIVEDGGALWLVMEHLPSRSLGEIVRQDGALEPTAVADIGAQVADGLAAAHAAGTMHRDVKPGNVLVREDGLAKISDFGIARTAGDPALTQSGLVTGTPNYFSPEVARGEAPGPAADVWALGATLYAAVDGHPPFRAQQNPVAVLHEIVTRSPARPRRAGPLEPVLQRMLDPDPVSRWSMADAAHGLRQVAQQRPVERTRPATLPVRAPAPVPEPARAAPPPSAPPPTRRRHGMRIALLLVVLGLAAAAGLGYLLTQHDGSRSTAGSSASSSPSASSKPSTSSKPATSATGGSTSSPSTTAAPAPAPASKAAFLRSYYSIAPGGTDAGWARLGPHEKAQGRAAYDGFWRGIDSVTVRDVRSVDPDTADLTLTYRKTDGGTSTERQRVDLVRAPGGGWLIDADQVIG